MNTYFLTYLDWVLLHIELHRAVLSLVGVGVVRALVEAVGGAVAIGVLVRVRVRVRVRIRVRVRVSSRRCRRRRCPRSEK